jgi:hypothetical protein
MSILHVFLIVIGTLVSIIILVLLFTLPAVISIKRGIRPGLQDMSLEDLVVQLEHSGVSGWTLVEEARIIVGARMAYCRRNNWEHYKTAFHRGYGFCQQKAYALDAVLRKLGFESRPVQAFRSRFSDGHVSGHAWVEVLFEGEKKWVDPQFQEPMLGKLLFEPITRVTGLNRFFRLFSGWGSAAVNAMAYYISGLDFRIPTDQ